MYATTQSVLPVAYSERPPDLQRLVDAAAGEPGCHRTYGLRPVDATGPVPITNLIALWDTERAARRYLERSRDVDGIDEGCVPSRRPDPGGTAYLLGCLHEPAGGET